MNTLVDMYNTAREAGANGLMHITPEPATIYHFCVMHLSVVDGKCISDKTECEFAEAVDCSNDSLKNLLASEYVAEYLNTHDIPWGSFTTGDTTSNRTK